MIFSLQIIDFSNHFHQIRTHRATVHASTAPDTGNLIIVIDKVFEFMHQPLTHPLFTGRPGIMAGRLLGKRRVHTRIPYPHATPLIVFNLINHVKTMTSRTKIGAYPATNTFLVNFIPYWMIEYPRQFFRQIFQKKLFFFTGKGYKNQALAIPRILILPFISDTQKVF